MLPWGPNPSRSDPYGLETPEVTVGWWEGVPGGTISHTMSVNYITPAVLARLLCHAVMGRLPDAGIPELAEALIQMMDYYSYDYQPERKLLPGRKTVPVREGRSFIRPLGQLAEE